MIHEQKGYILFITFSILAFCTALVSAFLVKGITHKKLMTALAQQERLEQFTISTTAMAQSFLAFSADEVSKLEQENPSAPASQQQPTGGSVQPSEKGSEKSFEKVLLEKVLPVVNKPQKFNLEEVIQDYPIIIELIFFAESGKINLNGLFDLTQKKFYDEGVPGKDQKVFATWLFEKIAKITGKPSLLQPFIEHVKQRKIPFNDVTELLGIKEFADCFAQAVFYEKKKQTQETDRKVAKLYLTDIFTVSSEHDTIQPWLLSPSLCALLDITEKESKQDQAEKKEDQKIDLSSFKLQADWATDWDAGLKQVYGISYDKIPEVVAGMFSKKFLATVFSVLACVSNKVQDSENNDAVKIFAILKQIKLPDNSIAYDVIKIYQV